MHTHSSFGPEENYTYQSPTAINPILNITWAPHHLNPLLCHFLPRQYQSYPTDESLLQPSAMGCQHNARIEILNERGKRCCIKKSSTAGHQPKREILSLAMKAYFLCFWNPINMLQNCSFSFFLDRIRERGPRPRLGTCTGAMAWRLKKREWRL